MSKKERKSPVKLQAKRKWKGRKSFGRRWICFSHRFCRRSYFSSFWKWIKLNWHVYKLLIECRMTRAYTHIYTFRTTEFNETHSVNNSMYFQCVKATMNAQRVSSRDWSRLMCVFFEDHHENKGEEKCGFFLRLNVMELQLSSVLFFFSLLFIPFRVAHFQAHLKFVNLKTMKKKIISFKPSNDEETVAGKLCAHSILSFSLSFNGR